MTCQLDAPPSKSMTQRALIIAALCDEATRIEGPLHCDDSRLLVGALRALGCRIDVRDDWIDVQPAPLIAPDDPSAGYGQPHAATIARARNQSI